MARPKIGRPSKYKPEYCEELIKHAAEGLSYESFAGKLQVNIDTLYEWEKVHPAFSEAKSAARKASLYFWEKVGVLGTTGKLKGFNATSWVFTMKCRHGWREPQQIDVNIGNPIQINIDSSDKDL